MCETNSNYGDLKGGIRKITGVGRLVGREPLGMTRTHMRVRQANTHVRVVGETYKQATISNINVQGEVQ